MAYNIGIVGYGKIARDQHVPSIMANPYLNLVGVVDPSLEGTVDGIRVFDNILQMLDLGKLDAVSICTPPAARCALAREAVMYGSNVLLEKPPAATVGEMHSLIELTDDTPSLLYLAWHSRYHATVSRARSFMRGKLARTMQVTWREDVRRWHPGQEWIWSAGGFGVFDPGINALSIVTEIIQYHLFVSRATLFFPSNASAPIAADLTLTSGFNGDTLRVEFDWRETGDQTWSIEIETDTNNTVSLLDGGSRLVIDGQEITDAPSDEYRDIYRDFVTCMDRGQSLCDITPLQLVSDAFMIGERVTVDRFTS